MTKQIKEMEDWEFYCGDISTYSEDWFYNRSFVCGEKTIDLFKKIFELFEENRIIINTANWNGQYFKINLFDEQVRKSFEVVIKKYNENERLLYTKYRFLILPNTFVILIGNFSNLTKGMIKTLKKLSDNLSKIRPSDLFNVVYNDNNKSVKKLYKPISVTKINSQNKDASYSKSLYDWGNKEINHTFLLNYNLINDQDWQIDLTGVKQFYLRCSDVECIYNHNIFDFSSCHREYALSRINQFDDEVLKDRDLFEKMILRNATFELKDEDIVLGCDSKIYNVLDKITQALKGFSINILLCSCMNKIIGNDINSIIKRINKKNNTLILCTECNAVGKPMEGIEDMIRTFLKTKKIHRFKNRLFNLIGFENDRGIKEITQILERFFNINLNTVLLPGVKTNSLKDFYKAKLQVLNHQGAFNDIFNKIFKEKNFDVLELQPPYGIKQTIKWLKSVGNYFKIAIDKNNNWKKYYAERMTAWKKLTKEAMKFRLGFIISKEDIELLTVPKKYPFGIPLLKYLKEMGFGINILFTSCKDFDYQKELLLDLFEDKNKINIELLNNPEKLDDWISETNCACIYSDFYNDIKIISHGKIPFSISLCEKGIDGAIRTLEELLRLCRIKFFSKYQIYYKQRPMVIDEG